MSAVVWAVDKKAAGRIIKKTRESVSVPHVRVVVAEDDLLVREGVQQLIAGLDGMDVVDAVGDLPGVEEAIELLRPDVVVTDIRLPPTLTDEGLRLASMLRERHPDVGVVILTRYAEPEYARTLLEAGGSGRAYLVKERVTDRGQLESAIRTVVAGGTYVDSAVVERVLAALDERTDGRVDGLTPREIGVIGLIAQGKSNEAVARELSISTRAVERHVNAIFRRLQIQESPDVSRRVMAVLIYLEDLRRQESSARAG